MSELRIESISDPFDGPRSAATVLQLFARAEAMGLIPETIARQDAITVDRVTVQRLLRRLREAGMASAPSIQLPSASTEAINLVLERALEALAASPYPPGEWSALRELVGDRLLARMLRISESSIRRYAAGGRRTPDEVAWRLHAIGGIVSALRGSYNEYGVRRWFDRPRAALDGLTPADVIADAESEDDAGFRLVGELADELLGAGTAA
ncbi:MAG: hypothetical protein ACRDOF_03150 [Gaiellaceae bacterium]